MAQKKNPFKDIRFIIFLAVVVSLFILFITSGKTDKEGSNKEVAESFDVPAKQEQAQDDDNNYYANEPIKDAGLDEAINGMASEKVDTTTQIKEKDIFTQTEKARNKEKETYGNTGKQNIKPKPKAKEEKPQVKPLEVNNIQPQPPQPQVQQGSTWRRGKDENKPGSLNFYAVVFGDTKLVNSRTSCKIRTTQDVTINEKVIPRNTIMVAYLSKGADIIEVTINDAVVNGEKLERSFVGYTSEGRGIKFNEENLRSNIKQETGTTAGDVSEINTGDPLTDIATRAVSRTLGDRARKDIITISNGTKLTFYSIN